MARETFTFGAPVSRGGCIFRPAAMPANTKPRSIQIKLFGAEAIVQVPHALAHLIQQASELQRITAGFDGDFITVYLYGLSMDKQGCKQFSGVCHVRNIERDPVCKACFALYIRLSCVWTSFVSVRQQGGTTAILFLSSSVCGRLRNAWWVPR
jgi:hypothetical protein